MRPVPLLPPAATAGEEHMRWFLILPRLGARLYWMTALRQQRPFLASLTQSGIDIRLTIGNTAQGAAALHEGAADLAFIEGMIEDPMLTKEQIARDSW